MASRFEGTVVVTGASSGIGTEIAKLVAAKAKTLILVARRKARLDALRDEFVAQYKDLTVEVVACDLSDRSATQALATELAARDVPVDVLVNNAGLGDFGLFELSNEKKTLGMIDLNIASLLILTRALLPGMIARKKGGVLMMSSGFGFAYLPGFAGYAASKYFVTGFTHALRAECAGTGVTITQVAPGPVHTEFEENAGSPTGHKVPPLLEISAVKCARAAVSAFERGCAVMIPGLMFKLLLFLNAISPSFIYRPITALFGRSLRKAQLATAGKSTSD